MKPSLILRVLACSASLVAVAPAAMAGTSTTVIGNPGDGSNRIEVTGNTAQSISVPCGKGGKEPTGDRGASVNSVNVERQALQGKTVIVAGRNSRNVQVDADCHSGNGASANVNSVNIR